MAGMPAYERSTYAQDIRALRDRGLSAAAIAQRLGMSRATVYRILHEAQTNMRRRTQ